MTLHVILGSGEMPTKEVNATLTDLWQKDTKAQQQHWYLIQAKPEPTETDRAIMAWMHKNEIWYDIVTDGDYDEKLYTDPQGTHTTKRLTPKVVDIMTKVQEGTFNEDDGPEPAQMLGLFTDLENFAAEEDRWLNDVGAAVQEAGFVVFALNDGMVEVDMSDAGEGDEAAAPEGDEPADVAAAFKSYTNEELLDMDRAAILDIAKERGIEMPPKTRIATYIKAILEQQEQTAAAIQPVEAEVEQAVGHAVDEAFTVTSSPALVIVIYGGTVITRAVEQAVALQVIGDLG